VNPAAVLDFWFGPPDAAAPAPREAWFRKSAAFDDEIRARFGTLVEAALGGPLPPPWEADAQARLAQLIVLDQFPRNLFRDSARAFAGDARALALAQRMVAAGEDRALSPLQRWFCYLPLEHAEDLALQDESVRLFRALADEASTDGLAATLAGALDYALRHRDVIARFGRFPHRNRVLGRASTPDELEYLRQPGAGF
jgi:uncharacterized protein (DUF924 family)